MEVDGDAAEPEEGSKKKKKKGVKEEIPKEKGNFDNKTAQYLVCLFP